MSPEARKTPRTALVRVPDAIAKGVEEFNTGRYFDCHETFEDIWHPEHGELRDLYKGLIQVAAGFVHITRGNAWGANRLLQTAVGYLDRYRPQAMGIDVEDVVQKAIAAHRQVNELGAAGIRQFDLANRPQWRFDPSRIPEEARRWQAWGFDDDGNALEMEIEVFD